MPPRPATWIALIFYMMMFVPHMKHISGPLRPVVGTALLFYMCMMFVPNRKKLWASTACYCNTVGNIVFGLSGSSPQLHLFLALTINLYVFR
jgi:hypothetical protein